MQKTKPNAAAGRAKAHNSGKAGRYGKAGEQGGHTRAGKARKPLTPEQRERKNRMDRERRKRIKRIKAGMSVENGAADASRRSAGCKGCGRCKDHGRGHGHGGGSACAGKPGVTAVDIAVVVGKHVARQVANVMPGRDVIHMSELQAVEPGVVRGEVMFSNGARAVVTMVDGNVIDPLSAYSPLPEQVKSVLLRRRIAQEVSDLVDAHIGMESEP